MKLSTTVLFFICFFVCNAQKDLDINIPFDPDLDKYAYQEIVEQNKPDSLLYSNAVKWLMSEFGNEVYLINDRNKKISKEISFEILHTVKAGMGIKMPTKYTILADLILEFKTERYRYTFTNFKISQNENATTPETTLETYVKSYEEMGMGKKRMIKFIEDICFGIDKEASGLIKKMKSGMASEHTTEDW